MNPLSLIRRHRPLVLLAAALGFGVLAVLGARSYIEEQIAIERARKAPSQPDVEVVVAKRDLKRGEVVGPDSMAVRRLPADGLPGSVVAPDRFEAFQGARLGAAMRAGEPLLSGLVEGADAVAFSAKVREGIRALTIAVDEVNALSGMLQPGDRIDLHVSLRPPARPGVPMTSETTAPLMQDILVLATGRQVRASADESRTARMFTTITVEVSPDQAQRLIVAQRAGRLTALLRNPVDRKPVAQRSIDVSDLLGLAVPVPRTGRAPPEIIVGGRGPLVTASGTSFAPAAMGSLPEAAAGIARLAGAWSPSVAGGTSPRPSSDAGAAGHLGASVAADGQTVAGSHR
jgi:pilus assembly protein CpaB